MDGRCRRRRRRRNAQRRTRRPPAAKDAGDDDADADAKPPKGGRRRPVVKQAPDEARGRTPTRGAETSAGSAIAETGIRGQGFGLSTGGGLGSGSRSTSPISAAPNTGDDVERIRRTGTREPGSAGEVDGEVHRFIATAASTEMDRATERQSPCSTSTAQRAVVATSQLPPLPSAFPNPTLTVHLNFQYQ